MSQHTYFHIHQDQPVTIIMGWDRPLQGFYMSVRMTKSPYTYLYTNLDDAALGSRRISASLDTYIAKLAELALNVPQELLDELDQESIDDVGNERHTTTVAPGTVRTAAFAHPATEVGKPTPMSQAEYVQFWKQCLSHVDNRLGDLDLPEGPAVEERLEKRVSAEGASRLIAAVRALKPDLRFVYEDQREGFLLGFNRALDLAAAMVYVAGSDLPYDPSLEMLRALVVEREDADAEAGGRARARLGATVLPDSPKYLQAYGKYQRLRAAMYAQVKEPSYALGDPVRASSVPTVPGQ